MKKLTLIAFCFILTLSCSSDDDNNPVDDLLTTNEILQQGSLWKYNKVEIETITRNELNLSDQELTTQAISSFDNVTFNFRQDNTLVITDNDTNQQSTYDYVVVGNSLSISGNGQFEIPQGVNITKNEFSFVVEYDQVNGNDTSISSVWSVRIFFD